MHNCSACLSRHEDSNGTVCLRTNAEVAKGWARYDDRVDVFSLGIVAFELWHPFSTGMERVALLQDLQEHGRLPADWAATNPKVCPHCCDLRQSHGSASSLTFLCLAVE